MWILAGDVKLNPPIFKGTIDFDIENLHNDGSRVCGQATFPSSLQSAVFLT